MKQACLAGFPNSVLYIIMFSVSLKLGVVFGALMLLARGILLIAYSVCGGTLYSSHVTPHVTMALLARDAAGVSHSREFPRIRGPNIDAKIKDFCDEDPRRKGPSNLWK